MTNEIQVFNNNDFGELRTIEKDGEIWFVAKDVCDALELTNPTMALGRLEDDERAKFNLGRQGNANIVNEYGLYSLVLASRKPEAKHLNVGLPMMCCHLYVKLGNTVICPRITYLL